MEIQRFDYTGSPQQLVLPIGMYKLEVYGAQGGGLNIEKSKESGGLGGLSIGILTVQSPITLYMYIGGTTTSKNGGWNGGGTGVAVYGGGGATDISLYHGEWNSNEHLYSRIIVAGGGGGAQTAQGGNLNTSYNGGHGGGIYGGDGIGSDCGFGGGPTYPGAGRGHYGSLSGGFGYGGNQTGHGNESVGCGGSGWYGGSSGGGYSDNGSGGGGSGYIYCEETKHQYPSGCLLNNSLLLDEPEMYSGINKGNGYIIVTKLSSTLLRKNSNFYKDSMLQSIFDFTKLL